MRLLLVALLLSGCIVSPSPSPSPAGELPSSPPEVPWGPEDAPIRPGARIGDEAFAGVATGRTGGCTGAFLFTDVNASVHMATAAHCLAADEVGVAGAARATVSYCSFAAEGGACATDPTSGDRNDFGLLRLRDEDRALAHPRVLGFAGPRGLVACVDLAAGDAVVAYGNSSYRPDAERVKMLQGEVVGHADAFTLVVRFTPPAIPADSGSPVLTPGGDAVGIVRALQLEGTTHVVCLDAALAAMEAAGGPSVALANP